MLQELTLKASTRNTGKHAARQLRREGRIPGIFYSKNDEGINISIKAQDIKPLVYTKQFKLVNLDIDGEQKKCILKEVKFDPITDKIIHFDLLGIVDDRKVTVELPIEFTGGQPIGVRKGGKLQKVFHKCKVTCLPKHILSTLQIDISNLDISDSIHLKDLDFEGLKFALPLDSLVCSVNTARGQTADEVKEAEGESDTNTEESTEQE